MNADEYEIQAREFFDNGDYINARKVFAQAAKVRKTPVESNYNVALCDAHIAMESANVLEKRKKRNASKKEYLRAADLFKRAKMVALNGYDGQIKFPDHEIIKTAICYMVSFNSNLFFLSPILSICI
jgi:hypothetical protein